MELQGIYFLAIIFILLFYCVAKIITSNIRHDKIILIYFNFHKEHQKCTNGIEYEIAKIIDKNMFNSKRLESLRPDMKIMNLYNLKHPRNNFWISGGIDDMELESIFIDIENMYNIKLDDKILNKNSTIKTVAELVANEQI